MRGIFWFIFVLFLDQLTKYFILKFKPNLIVQNPGFLFGLERGFPGLLIALIILVIIFLIYSRHFSNFINRNAGSFNLLVAGGLSNLIDRVFRGFVIDYIHIRGLPVFNIADLAIVLGGIVLVWRIIFHTR